ncbi:MAG: M48 family metallopeptidase, partial [Pseudomonadota bacterium]|nr:M48 family metallopeptidase [Pseudomonadota bacterium]
TDAHKYGLKKGDKIIAVNGIDVSSDKDKANKISDAFANNTQDINKVLILSGNREREIALKAQEVCNYRMLYFPNSLEVNAMADGKRVFFMRGMYRIAKDDNELALIIGHEIAHNVMKHSKKKEWNSLWLRGLANAYNIALILRTPYVLNEDMVDYAINEVRDINSVDFEREADYIGMYFAERAGYDTSNAIGLWRKMAVEFSGSSIERRNTHPATAERFVYLQKTHDEIKAKRQNNQPLIPKITWRDDRVDIDLVNLSETEQDSEHHPRP